MDKYSRLGLRRLRSSPQIRNLTREVHLNPNQFIQPLFVVESLPNRQEVKGLNGVFRDTSESLLKQVESDLEKGVRSFLLFGVPATKSLDSFDPSFTASQVNSLKEKFGKDIFLSVDVCLCSYTSHGHCGVLNEDHNHVLNAESVNVLADFSVAYAQAGADCVAPSDMMDGRVGAIRNALDSNNQNQTILMSYAAKFHSRFYGPFRSAADSAPGKSALSDRATYQIDPARPTDAFASVERDVAESADILMVKPGLPYLDVLKDLSQKFSTKPWAVYEVSGEYAAIELLAGNGLTNGPAAHVESWQALKRAGASMIISYGARDARQYINESI